MLHIVCNLECSLLYGCWCIIATVVLGAVCSGVEQAGPFQHVAFLFAPDGPDRPIISPPETLYSLGSNVTLSCFANSNPPANYLWYYNGQQLEQQNTSQHLILNLSWTDEGNYVCNASNEVTGLFNYSSQPISLMSK